MEPCGFGLDRGAGAGAFAPGGRGAGTSRIVEIGGRVTRRCLHELVASRPRAPFQPPGRGRDGRCRRPSARGSPRWGDPREVDSAQPHASLRLGHTGPPLNASPGVSPGGPRTPRGASVASRTGTRVPTVGGEREPRIATAESGVTTTVGSNCGNNDESTYVFERRAVSKKNTLLCLSNTVSSIIYRVAPFSGGGDRLSRDRRDETSRNSLSLTRRFGPAASPCTRARARGRGPP